ncbi:MAG: hypothetical protein KDA69_04895 [Planctomycetaceae bacterium]|nr:hypothetical protein [Planctomycetaceae bacterium]MCA9043635.1 hypothetical protein [Planctomycetaceae bacterium]
MSSLKVQTNGRRRKSNSTVIAVAVSFVLFLILAVVVSILNMLPGPTPNNSSQVAGGEETRPTEQSLQQADPIEDITTELHVGEVAQLDGVQVRLNGVAIMKPFTVGPSGEMRRGSAYFMLATLNVVHDTGLMRLQEPPGLDCFQMTDNIGRELRRVEYPDGFVVFGAMNPQQFVVAGSTASHVVAFELPSEDIQHLKFAVDGRAFTGGKGNCVFHITTSDVQFITDDESP